MRKIGFVDYYLSEWHANNYPAWIKAANEALGTDYEVAYAWAELETSPKDGVTTAAWCEKFGATPCESLSELCEKSDNIIVLAPSNPESHLRLASEVFKYAGGKRIYIDKTFAPDYATAKEIYRLAEEQNITFFSTSALRYGEEIQGLENVVKCYTRGNGSNMEEYIIHQVEMIVKILGVGASEVCAVVNEPEEYVCNIKYNDEREAGVRWCKDGFLVTATKKDGSVYETKVASAFFMKLMAKILNFFETGEIDFTKEQTLEVMKLREKVIEAKGKVGEWIKL